MAAKVGEKEEKYCRARRIFVAAGGIGDWRFAIKN
jgi:hypothetical protein